MNSQGSIREEDEMQEEIDKQIDDAKVACLYDIRLKLLEMDKESFSKQEICEFLDRMALDKLRNS